MELISYERGEKADRDGSYPHNMSMYILDPQFEHSLSQVDFEKHIILVHAAVWKSIRVDHVELVVMGSPNDS